MGASRKRAEAKGGATSRAATPEALGKTDVFIAVFLALQVLIPLRYYLGDDTFDERFSWRMFSAVRVVECDTQAFETRDDQGEQRVNLPELLQSGWISNLKRNRDVVVRAYLRRRCEETGTREVRVVNNCTSAEGTAMAPLSWTRSCVSGEEQDP